MFDPEKWPVGDVRIEIDGKDVAQEIFPSPRSHGLGWTVIDGMVWYNGEAPRRTEGTPIAWPCEMTTYWIQIWTTPLKRGGMGHG
jgi:hypothetical protein